MDKKSDTLIAVPVNNNGDFFQKQYYELKQLDWADLLIIDDSDDSDAYDLVEDHTGAVFIKHELPLGYGASCITAYEYARDLGYETILLIDPENPDAREDIKTVLENLRYGYDIVSCSRILENYDVKKIKPDYLNITSELSLAIKSATDMDVTDPLTGILGARMASLLNLELTDYTHGILLQLWIQSAYFKLTTLEIPAQSGESFGRELELYEDPLGMFLAIIETERYLYPRETMN